MKRQLKILRIYYYGKIKLAKRMKQFNMESGFYFAYYGERATSFKELDDLWKYLKDGDKSI